MASAEQRNNAKAYLQKSKEYLESAKDNFDLKRYTPASGDAIHAGISAKDAIVMMLTGRTTKARDHSAASKELRQALGQRAEAAPASKALAELIAAKSEVEYGVSLVGVKKSEPLVRRAETLVVLAENIVRLGR